jgi:hypothetical protein
VQLDRTRIAICERTWRERLDLGLHVLAMFPGPLTLALAAGALPLALANAALLHALGLEAGQDPARYAIWLTILTTFEAPLATAPLTLYLGKALFFVPARAGDIARELAASLGQLAVFQVLLRSVFFAMVVLVFVPYSSWPYLNEVILLERNPLRRRRNELSTMGRSSALHAGMGGELFGQWLGTLALGAGLVLGVWFSGWFLWLVFAGRMDFPPLMFSVGLAAALWLVAGYLAIVRFLNYLDLRIRREGWEVELKLRAERSKLLRQVA